jgi:hypothetical protein
LRADGSTTLLTRRGLTGTDHLHQNECGKNRCQNHD